MHLTMYIAYSNLWLIFCLLVPFTEVVLRTAIEVLAGCGCAKCEELEKRNASKVVEEKKKKTPPSHPAPQVWIGGPSLVAPNPEQVSTRPSALGMSDPIMDH